MKGGSGVCLSPRALPRQSSQAAWRRRRIGKRGEKLCVRCMASANVSCDEGVGVVGGGKDAVKRSDDIVRDDENDGGAFECGPFERMMDIQVAAEAKEEEDEIKIATRWKKSFEVEKTVNAAAAATTTTTTTTTKKQRQSCEEDERKKREEEMEEAWRSSHRRRALMVRTNERDRRRKSGALSSSSSTRSSFISSALASTRSVVRKRSSSSSSSSSAATSMPALAAVLLLNGTRVDSLRRRRSGGRKTKSFRGAIVVTSAVSDQTSEQLLASLGEEDDLNELNISFDHESDHEATLLSIEGPNRQNLLLSVTGVLSTLGMTVLDATISTDKNNVRDIFRIIDSDGAHLSEEKESLLRARLLSTLKGSRSAVPAIYGVAASVEAQMLSQRATEGSTAALELAAAEMATAAANLVALEREISQLQSANVDGIADNAILEREVQRAESAAVLERRMAAMEAALAARKVPEPVVTQVPSFGSVGAITTGPASGNGYELLLQAFNWESCKSGKHYKTLMTQVEEFVQAGFTALWLPPATDSVSEQGYLPRDLYDLNSRYGSEAELRELLQTLRSRNLKSLADIVINHRCAHYQDDSGRWNKFGGRLEWPTTAITNNNPEYGGTGSRKNTEDYTAAPNIDHSQEFVRKDIVAWLQHLRKIGYDGWRFDFVKGYQGEFTRIYVDESVPQLSIGEYWDSCSYTDGVLNYNQDAHRQREVDWCDATGGTSAAFDFTTKGILQEAVSRNELWRLIDSQGQMPGLAGIWPSRAVTFLENHDTGSTLNHWPFPYSHIAEGYAYLLTHPGTPCVFYDHYMDDNFREGIKNLIDVRRRNGIHARSDLRIIKAAADVYAACVDEKICVKVGAGDWCPNWEGGHLGKKWEIAYTGNCWATWECHG